MSIIITETSINLHDSQISLSAFLLLFFFKLNTVNEGDSKIITCFDQYHTGDIAAAAAVLPFLHTDT